jgi:hypothetical protein
VGTAMRANAAVSSHDTHLRFLFTSVDMVVKYNVYLRRIGSKCALKQAGGSFPRPTVDAAAVADHLLLGLQAPG